MKIQIITLFPEMFEGVLNSSMLWKAQEKKLVGYKLINLRDFGIGPRKTVDDIPYGGGDGRETGISRNRPRGYAIRTQVARRFFLWGDASARGLGSSS